MKSLRILLLPLLLVFLSACSGRVVLDDPAPIAVPTHVSLEQVRQVVRESLSRRGWTPTTAGPSAFDGRYSRRGLSAEISVTYDTNDVVIKYVGSEGLKFKQKGDERYIHGNYNKWIDRLVREINVRLSRIAN
ncbi:MAG: hypothetical protein ACRETM_10845 [Stenotrophobium sp.]